MTSSFPRAIIFDWDNTLVDSWGTIADAMNTVRRHFGQVEWSLPEILQNTTRSARDAFPDWYGERAPEAAELYYKRFAEIQMVNLKAMPGAGDLLQWLHQEKIPLFVVSNKRGDNLRRETAGLKWEHFFQRVAGATDAPKDKPAREHVDYVLADTGLNAGTDVWFIGDSEIDMICARNAGCTPVLVGNLSLAGQLGVELAFSDCQGLQRLLKEGRNRSN